MYRRQNSRRRTIMQRVSCRWRPDSNPDVSGKAGAVQWRFFRRCPDRTLNRSRSRAVASSPRIAQLKFEIDSKVRAYYQRRGKPVKFVFRLMHRRDLQRRQIPLRVPGNQSPDLHPRDGKRYLAGRQKHPAGAALNNAQSATTIGAEGPMARRESSAGV
jgi:hypothetical protein